jgi:sugar phosphate isomerase/epimerase
MYNFSIVADRHLGACLEEQLDACGRLLVNHVELDGEALLPLSGIEMERIRSLLISKGKKIVLVDFGFEDCDQEQVNLFLRKAHRLGVENINLAISPGDISDNPDGLAARLRSVLPAARNYGIGVTIENKRDSCLCTEGALAGAYRSCGDPAPGWVFNPMEFAAKKTHPFFHAFYNSRLKRHIRFLRINDGLFLDGSPALPAEGNAELKEMASALLARSFKGYFSFHPYLPETDSALYADVMDRFKGLLMSM